MSDAALASLLPLAVTVPLSASVLVLLLSRLSGRLALVVTLVSLAGSGTVVAALVPAVLRGKVIVHYLGHVLPVHGQSLGIGWAADGFGTTLALAAAWVGVVLVVYALSEVGDLGPRETGYFCSLFLLLDAGIIGAALTADLINLFVWFEVAALSSYALTAFLLDRPPALEAALKIVVLTTMASFAVFMGAVLLYADHGALNMAQLHDAMANGYLRRADLVGLGLLVVGFGTKWGLVPFHAWLPDAHTAAPGAVSALFSGLMVALGAVAAGRVVLQMAPPGSHLLGVLMVLGVVTGLVGALLALVQDDLKRVLAYDTVSQMGVVAVALASHTATGAGGAAYHLLNHALFKSLLFLCAGAVIIQTGTTKLSEMGGLARRMPLVAGAFVLGSASLIGIPPLNGYGSRLLIHQGLTDSHQTLAAAGLVLVDVLTFGALVRAAWLAFFSVRHDDYEPFAPLRPGMAVALVLLGSSCVAAGVAVAGAERAARPAAAALIDPFRWASAVLANGGSLRLGSLHAALVSPDAVVSLVVTLAGGAAVARWAIRARVPVAIQLSALHTGIVNDYAAWWAGGTAAVLGTLLLVAT